MAWVRSEYANELAVLSTWLCALLPYSVSYAAQGPISLVELRWPLVVIRYLFGVDVAGGSFVKTPVGAYQFAAGDAAAGGYVAGIVGGLVFLVAFALSVALYLREEQVEAWLVDPARVFGALLSLSGLVFIAASYQFYANWFAAIGISLPVGALFQLLFGGLLLTVDRS